MGTRAPRRARCARRRALASLLVVTLRRRDERCGAPHELSHSGDDEHDRGGTGRRSERPPAGWQPCEGFRRSPRERVRRSWPRSANNTETSRQASRCGQGAGRGVACGELILMDRKWHIFTIVAIEGCSRDGKRACNRTGAQWCAVCPLYPPPPPHPHPSYHTYFFRFLTTSSLLDSPDPPSNRKNLAPISLH